MKTSVKNLMMSFALMGCLIIGASDASAQGRSRSQGGSTNRSQSAAVSRTGNSSRPSVSRNSSIHRDNASAPQVNRSSSASNRGTLDRGSRNTDRTTMSSPTTRTTRGATTRGNTDRNIQSKGHDIAPRDNKGSLKSSIDRTSLSDKGKNTIPNQRPDVITGRGDKNRGGNMGNNDRNGHKDRNDNMGNNDRGKNRDRNGNMGNNDRNGHKDRNGNMGKNDRDKNRDRNGNRHDNRHDNGHRGYSPHNHYDYSNHHYRDQFRWNYSHHSWSRPLPPPARAHRPAPILWHRPVIPAGWRPYASAPIIDRILGLMFGTLYEASLDHLYYNGYFIDGYADGIIYLRDVSMMDLYWPDVMLNYEYNKLVNAQFVYHSSYYDRARFDRVYRSLCRVYGSPVFQDGMTISWYGGNNTGWVTLTMNENYGDYYTTMSIGY